jgi:riboflavin synthase
MFTGIIEHVGTVARVSRGSDSTSLAINAGTLTEGMRPGDSVAVNGACLTVEKTNGGAFTATAVPETLARTTLQDARAGDAVNLERAMSAGGRFDGHFVQGHVDGMETIVRRTADREGERVAVSLAPDIAPFVAPKGSIAVDGVSLTVVDVTEDGFSFTLVPFTLEHTALGAKRAGARVNLEVDVLAKYVWRMLQAGRAEGGRLDEAFLAEHGFAD